MTDAQMETTSDDLGERAITSVRRLMTLVDNGVLVRNTASDDDPAWASKQLPLVMALKEAHQIVIDDDARQAEREHGERVMEHLYQDGQL